MSRTQDDERGGSKVLQGVAFNRVTDSYNKFICSVPVPKMAMTTSTARSTREPFDVSTSVTRSVNVGGRPEATSTLVERAELSAPSSAVFCRNRRVTKRSAEFPLQAGGWKSFSLRRSQTCPRIPVYN